VSRGKQGHLFTSQTWIKERKEPEDGKKHRSFTTGDVVGWQGEGVPQAKGEKALQE
jgi:hypothetical protein